MEFSKIFKLLILKFCGLREVLYAQRLGKDHQIEILNFQFLNSCMFILIHFKCLFKSCNFLKIGFEEISMWVFKQPPTPPGCLPGLWKPP